jgi:regulatory protein
MSVLITRIESQKKKKNRYSLYSESNFILGVSDESLLAFKIHAGVELSDEILTQIIEQELLISIRGQALRYLARRPHSCSELNIKLVQKGYDPNIIETLIDDLKGKNYLNDEEFSRAFILDSIKIKRDGPLLIKHKLINKGIHTTLIQKMLSELYPENTQFQNCKWLAYKKVKMLSAVPIEKRRKQLAAYLRRKGFNWEIVKTIVFDIIREDDDELF